MIALTGKPKGAMVLCMKYITIALCLCLTNLLTAQNADNDELRREIEALKERISTLEEESDDQQKLTDRKIDFLFSRFRIYGDVALRAHFAWSDGERNRSDGSRDQLLRPEYRVTLGVTGALNDRGKHQIRYNIRLANEEGSEFDAPLGVPSESFASFESFGSEASVKIDRYSLQDDYKSVLRIAAGKFTSPFFGTSMVFDRDFGLTGLSTEFDLGHLSGLTKDLHSFDDWTTFEVTPEASEAESSPFNALKRLNIVAAAYYLSHQDSGLPNINDNDIAHGFSLQTKTKWRFSAGVDTALILAGGFHYFHGIDSVAAQVGTGTTASTTNSVDTNGNLLSNFRLVDLYMETIFFEERVASLKFLGHVVWNPGADDNSDEGLAIAAGFQWGALRLEESADFRISYMWYYIERDAVIPQFNHEVLNSNYRGHAIGVSVMLTRNIIAFGNYYHGSRIESGFMGVGRTSNGQPGSPSDDSESRAHIGISLRF